MHTWFSIVCMLTSQTTSSTACTCAESPIMSVREAAKALGRSPEYLYVGLRSGRFPGVRFGRSRGIHRSLIHGFLSDIVEGGRQMSFEEYAAAWQAEPQ